MRTKRKISTAGEVRRPNLMRERLEEHVPAYGKVGSFDCDAARLGHGIFAQDDWV